jgi:hypothetical protein
MSENGNEQGLRTFSRCPLNTKNEFYFYFFYERFLENFHGTEKLETTR